MPAPAKSRQDNPPKVVPKKKPAALTPAPEPEPEDDDEEPEAEEPEKKKGAAADGDDDDDDDDDSIAKELHRLVDDIFGEDEDE